MLVQGGPDIYRCISIFKSVWPSDANRDPRSSLVQVRTGTEPLTEPMWIQTSGTNFHEIWIKTFHIHLKYASEIGIWKMVAILFGLSMLWPCGMASTFAQVMADFLTAPSHYLNQCWLIIKDGLWHLPEDNFSGYIPDIYCWYEFENYQFKITATSPMDKWVNQCGSNCRCYILSYRGRWQSWPAQKAHGCRKR